MSLILNEVAIFKSSQKYTYQAGRQPDERGAVGEIHFLPKQNYEQALQDIEGCSHLWIIFGFHQNSHWKPLVQTPRGGNKKVGVFATRAPYRPNPIGISLVQLVAVDDDNPLILHVGYNDILDGSPIYDIKPYHPQADFAADAKISWLDENKQNLFKINFSPFAEDQLEWLAKNNLSEIKTFILRQLEYDPLNSKKKRVREQMGFWTLAYRTWRIDFNIHESSHSKDGFDAEDNQIAILGIHSGYTNDDLSPEALLENDKYQDKKLHIQFKKQFE